MVYNLIITDNASDELDEIIRYIAGNLDNLKAASDFLDRINDIYSLLADNPRIYQLCQFSEFKQKQYRKVVIKNYVMIYKIDDNTGNVYIMHFFYGRRDYNNLV